MSALAKRLAERQMAPKFAAFQHAVNEFNIKELMTTFSETTSELQRVKDELATKALQPTYLEKKARSMTARGPQFSEFADILSRLATDAAALQSHAEPRIQRCEAAHAVVYALVEELNLACRNGDIEGVRRATEVLRSEMVGLSGDLEIKDIIGEGRRIVGETETQHYEFSALRRTTGGARERRDSVVE